ncbi:hypothetical protein A2U01_0093847, partial [Trifolium medium]|nr:hypothetical protein [Trifolium medium]
GICLKLDDAGIWFCFCPWRKARVCWRKVPSRAWFGLSASGVYARRDPSGAVRDREIYIPVHSFLQPPHERESEYL